MSEDTISIEGLDKAAVLAALYNASRPQGMGFMKYDPNPMTVEQAREILSKQVSFDYLMGRVMKISLDSDDLDTWGYDRDNGQGAAAKVIAELRATMDVNSAASQEAHLRGRTDAARVASGLPTEGSQHTEGDFLILGMGLDDAAKRIARELLDDNEES